MRRFTLKQYVENYTGNSKNLVLDTSNWEPDLWSINKEPDMDYQKECLDFLLKKQTFINSDDFSEDEIEELISIKKETFFPVPDINPEYKETDYSLLINLKDLYHLIKAKEKEHIHNHVSSSEYLNYDNFRQFISDIMPGRCIGNKLTGETLSEDDSDKDSNFYALMEVLEFFADGMSLSEFKEEIMPMIKTVVSKTSDYYGEYYEAQVFQEINLKKVYQKLIDLNYLKESILTNKVNI